MHGFHSSLQKRIEALERRFGAVPETETPAQTSRRLVLCRMALAGETPEDLTEEEETTFPKIEASVPIFQELVHEGLVDRDGRPQGGDDYPDPMLGEIVDDQGDGENAWRA